MLSGFGLATITLLLLGLLTWFATLEQVDNGLYPTLNKYFDWKSVFPAAGDQRQDGAAAAARRLLGVRGAAHQPHRSAASSGSAKVGNTLATSSPTSASSSCWWAAAWPIIFPSAETWPSGKGDSSNAAEDYFEYVVEVAEIKDGKAGTVHVIRGKDIDDLTIS